jgi:arylsulfatase
MLTGMYPSRHGILENAQALSPSTPTMFTILAAKGYDTAAFISFVPAGRDGNPAPGAALVSIGSDTGPGGPKLVSTWEKDANTALKAIEWLKARDPQSAKPFFVWIHFYDVHHPYGPQAPFDRMFIEDYRGPLLVREGAPEQEFGTVSKRLDEAALRIAPLDLADHAYVLALYDGSIRGVDRHVGAILRTLDEKRLSGTTGVIVTADHGEELGDHNDYYYHGNSVYDAALRIPFLMRWPGKTEPGVVDPIVQNVDLAPTLWEWMGIAGGESMEGISFAGALTASAPPARSAAYSEWQDLIVAVRTPDWKFIFNPKGAHPKKPPYYDDRGSNKGFRVDCEELYDVIRDPAEKANLVKSDSVRAASLRALAIEHQKRPGAGQAMVPTEEGAVTEELRSLGYVGAPADRSDVILNAQNCPKSES